LELILSCTRTFHYKRRTEIYFSVAPSGSSAMNRLFLGAIGLLVCLSVTSSAKPQEIVLGDFKDIAFQPGKAKYDLTSAEKDDLVKLLRSPSSDKYQFIVEGTYLMYADKNQDANLKKAEDRIIGVLESLNSKYIAARGAEYTQLSTSDKLKALEENGGENLDEFKSRSQLRYEAARLFHYIARLRDMYMDNFDVLKDHPKFSMLLKYVGRYEELASKEKPIPEKMSVEEANKHSLVDWSRKKWDETYASLPEIKKYFASGLNPTTKPRLNKNFKILDDHKDYNMKKKMSQKHIDHIAIQARLEAIKHSHTAAGKYFATHENWIADKLRQIDCEMGGCENGPKMMANKL